MERPSLTAEDIVEIEALEDEVVSDILAELPADQRDALAGHIVADRSYEDLARSAGVSPSAIRHRVSRGLRTLRRQKQGGER